MLQKLSFLLLCVQGKQELLRGAWPCPSSVPREVQQNWLYLEPSPLGAGWMPNSQHLSCLQDAHW